MNKTASKIFGLHTKIEKLIKLSSKLKILAGACLFFSFCYCYGTKRIENIDRGQVLLTNIVWIISMIVLVGLYIKDSYCVKNRKLAEFEIYRLEVEDLNNKKNVARVKEIDMPNEKVSLPIVYYSILLGLDILIRISLIKFLSV